MGHFPYACFNNPKPKKELKRTEIKRSTKPIKQIGKGAVKWMVTRKQWIKENPPPIEGTYWECYLQIHPWCPKRLDLQHLTLDHVVPRSHDSKLRYDATNLKPACIYCNEQKGSKSLEKALASKVI